MRTKAVIPAETQSIHEYVSKRAPKEKTVIEYLSQQQIVSVDEEQVEEVPWSAQVLLGKYQ